MLVSLALALVLDALTTQLARFSRLMIFLPYAIPAVIGALMWGFLYSPTFGPMQQLANIFGANAPFLLSPDLVFVGLHERRHLAVGRLLHDHHLRRAAGHRLLHLRGGSDGRGERMADRVPDQGPDGQLGAAADLGLRLIGTLQFFTEPQILRPLSNGTITPDFTPNIYAFSQAFSYANFNYASAISFALGIVVFIAVYVFLFFTRKRGSIFT